MLVALSTAMPLGLLNRAVAPMPSALPFSPQRPARVVTTPLGVTLRMVQFSESATYTLPAPSTATPVGKENLALLPTPSAQPPLPEGFANPASVVTDQFDPTGVIFRIV